MYHDSAQRGWTVGMAQGADVVIACFGLDNMMEGEEGDAVETLRGDRDKIELPAHQLEYLKAVRERGTPVVLVLTGGEAIAFPRDIADAVLFAWYPGEEGGNAVADIIFGDANPSGHLPVTFPEKTEDLPDFSDYDMKGRTYRYATKTPLYPFGFGLTYTKWQFTDLECIKESDTVSVKVKVNNTGNTDGDECVQVYVQKNNRDQADPLYSLKAFKKVSVKKGESAEVKFDLPLKAFETITQEGESQIQSGTYTVIVADSAPDPVAVTLGASEWIKGSVNI